MRVQIIDDNGNIIWEHGYRKGIRGGIANAPFIQDGTQQEIVNCISLARDQALGELSVVLEDRDGMPDCCASAT